MMGANSRLRGHCKEEPIDKETLPLEVQIKKEQIEFGAEEFLSVNSLNVSDQEGRKNQGSAAPQKSSVHRSQRNNENISPKDTVSHSLSAYHQARNDTITHKENRSATPQRKNDSDNRWSSMFTSAMDNSATKQPCQPSNNKNTSISQTENITSESGIAEVKREIDNTIVSEGSDSNQAIENSSNQNPPSETNKLSLLKKYEFVKSFINKLYVQKYEELEKTLQNRDEKSKPAKWASILEETCYSKYSVQSKRGKKNENTMTQLKDIVELSSDESDSAESILEVPIPPKPKPPVIDLPDSEGDSDEENTENASVIKKEITPMASVCDKPNDRKPYNLRSKQIRWTDDTVDFTDSVWNIDATDIILNCTKVQKGAASIQEIREMRKSVQREKSLLTDREKKSPIITKSEDGFLENKSETKSNIVPERDKFHTASRKRRYFDTDNELSTCAKYPRMSCAKNSNARDMGQMDDEEDLNEEPTGGKFNVAKIQSKMSKNPRLWAILDEDLMPKPKDRPVIVRCTLCLRDGHARHDCPDRNKPPRCRMCGAEGHPDTWCPQRMCLTCGKKQPRYRQTCDACRVLYCSMCKSVGHEHRDCPDLWRRFHQTTQNVEITIPEHLAMVMKPKDLLVCCNCTKKGHDASMCRDFRWTAHFPTPAFVTNYIDGPDYVPPPEHNRMQDDPSLNDPWARQHHKPRIEPWIIPPQSQTLNDPSHMQHMQALNNPSPTQHMQPQNDPRMMQHVQLPNDPRSVQHVEPPNDPRSMQHAHPSNDPRMMQHVQPPNDPRMMQHVQPPNDPRIMQHVQPPNDPRIMQHAQSLNDPSHMQQHMQALNDPSHMQQHMQALNDPSHMQHVQPPNDPRIMQLAQPPNDPRIMQHAQPPNDPRIMQHAQPPNDPRIMQHAQPPNDPRIMQHMQPLNDPRVMQHGPPLNDPRVMQHGPPLNDPRVMQHGPPLNDPRVMQHGPPLNDPRVMQHGPPLNDPRVMQNGPPLNDPSHMQHVQPMNDPRMMQQVQPLNDPRIMQHVQSLNDPRIMQHASALNDPMIIQQTAQLLNDPRFIQSLNALSYQNQFPGTSQDVNLNVQPLTLGHLMDLDANNMQPLPVGVPRDINVDVNLPPSDDNHQNRQNSPLPTAPAPGPAPETAKIAKLLFSCGEFDKRKTIKYRQIYAKISRLNYKYNLTGLMKGEKKPNFLKALCKFVEFAAKMFIDDTGTGVLYLIAPTIYLDVLYNLVRHWLQLEDEDKDRAATSLLPKDKTELINILRDGLSELTEIHNPFELAEEMKSLKTQLIKSNDLMTQATIMKNLSEVQLKLVRVYHTAPKVPHPGLKIPALIRSLESMNEAIVDPTNYLKILLVYNKLFLPFTPPKLDKALTKDKNRMKSDPITYGPTHRYLKIIEHVTEYNERLAEQQKPLIHIRNPLPPDPAKVKDKKFLDSIMLPPPVKANQQVPVHTRTVAGSNKVITKGALQSATATVSSPGGTTTQANQVRIVRGEKGSSGDSIIPPELRTVQKPAPQTITSTEQMLNKSNPTSKHNIDKNTANVSKSRTQILETGKTKAATKSSNRSEEPTASTSKGLTWVTTIVDKGSTWATPCTSKESTLATPCTSKESTLATPCTSKGSTWATPCANDFECLKLQAQQAIDAALKFQLSHMNKSAQEVKNKLKNKTLTKKHIQVLNRLVMLEKKHQKYFNQYCTDLH